MISIYLSLSIYIYIHLHICIYIERETDRYHIVSLPRLHVLPAPPDLLQIHTHDITTCTCGCNTI